MQVHICSLPFQESLPSQHHQTFCHAQRSEQVAAQHCTAQHCTAQHCTALHSTAQHSTAQHSAAQHSTAQRSIALVQVYILPDALVTDSDAMACCSSMALKVTHSIYTPIYVYPNMNASLACDTIYTCDSLMQHSIAVHEDVCQNNHALTPTHQSMEF